MFIDRKHFPFSVKVAVAEESILKEFFWLRTYFGNAIEKVYGDNIFLRCFYDSTCLVFGYSFKDHALLLRSYSSLNYWLIEFKYEEDMFMFLLST